MDDGFFGKVIHAAVFLAICAVIVSIGWNEPLQYRFLTTREIAEIEGPPPAPPLPKPTPWFAENLKGTRLDEAPRRTSGNGAAINSRPYRKPGGLEPPPARTPGTR